MNYKNNRPRIAYRRKLPPLIGVSVLLIGAVADAEANWRVYPELGAGVEHDDNTRLNDIPGLSDSETGYGVEALATFFYDAELTDFTITPRIRSTRYNDDSSLDSDDLFLKFDLDHVGQKSNFRFRGDYARESIRTAERSDVDFGIEDPDEIPVDDTGRVFDTGDRDRFRLAPAFSYSLTQRTSFEVYANFQDTSYDEDVSVTLSDFSEFYVGGSLGYGWTEKDTISLYGYVGSYDVEGSDSDSSSSAYGISYDRKLSARTEFRMAIGDDTSEDSNDVDQSNTVGEVSIIHKYISTRVIASYQRRISGSGTGSLSVRDSINLNVTRDLSPRLTLGGGVRAYTTDALDSSDTSFIERDYLQLRAMARWNLSRSVSLEFDYRFTDIDRDIPDDTAVNGDSNRVGLWIYWHPNPLPK